jgi:IS5 family transposase
MWDMNQTNFGFDPVHERTRTAVFLEEMYLVVVWDQLVALMTPHARGAHQALGGRPPVAAEVMLHIRRLQL